jgi:hypothetical protein
MRTDVSRRKEAMKKLSRVTRAAALIGACAALGVTGLALADRITGDANSITTNIDPSVAVSQGSSGSGKFGLVVNDNNGADPINGCNARTGGSKPPVVLSVASNQSWLTLGQSAITLTNCDTGTTADGLQNAIPVKFSLSGNQGLNILKPNYPTSAVINCATSAPTDTIEETVTAGGSSLTYDASADQYVYVWKTDKTWAGKCREFSLGLADGTTPTARFSFTK